MKDDMLRKIKRSMQNVLAGITLENVEEKNESISKHFLLLKVLSETPLELQHQPRKIVSPPTQQSVSNNQLAFDFNTTKDEILIQSEELQEEIDTREAFLFERKLRGGIASSLLNDLSYHVPEKVIRELNVCHGDKLYISPTSQPNKYTYEIAERGDGVDAPKRKQFEHCIVEWSGGKYYVQKTANGEITLDGYSHKFYLKDNEVDDFEISEGDIIDVAHYENQNDVRIIWRHEVINPNAASTTISAPKKSTPKEPKEPRQFPIDYAFFEGKVVTIVGSDFAKHTYQLAFSGIDNFTVNHWGVNDPKNKIETAIKKSDIVLMPNKYTGHHMQEFLKERCKHYKVLFKVVDNDGAQFMLMKAEEALKLWQNDDVAIAQ